MTYQYNNNTIEVYKIVGDQFTAMQTIVLSSNVVAASFSADGSLIQVLGRDIYSLNTLTNMFEFSYTMPSSPSIAVAFSSKRNLMARGENSNQLTLLEQN